VTGSSGHRRLLPLGQRSQKARQILQALSLDAGQINGNAVLDTVHFDQYRKIRQAERPDVVFSQ
jgi:hypothetical protein